MGSVYVAAGFGFCNSRGISCTLHLTGCQQDYRYQMCRDGVPGLSGPSLTRAQPAAPWDLQVQSQFGNRGRVTHMESFVSRLETRPQASLPQTGPEGS